MTRKSRLRTKGDKGRWLFLLVLLVLAGIGVVMWLVSMYRPNLAEEFLHDWNLLGSHDQAEDVNLRGTVYDRNYKELAVSYERVSIYANIREITDLSEVARALAPILDQPEKTIYDRLSGNTLRLWLAKDISQEQEERVRALDLPGISFHKEYVRYYPQKESGAHLLGFVERNSGLSGIEYLLDQLETKYRLKKTGTIGLERIAEGRPGVDGNHLILTLDLKIQKTIDRFLEKHAAARGNGRMGVMVMEADTGNIVGYSQVPSFDPNRFHTFSTDALIDVFDSQVAVPEEFRLFLRDMSLIQSEADNGSEPLPWSVAAEKRKLGVQLQLWETLGATAGTAYDFINSKDGEQGIGRAVSGNTGLRDLETVPAVLTPLQLITSVARSINGGKEVVPHGGGRYILRDNHVEYLLEELNPPVRENILKNGVPEEVSKLFSAMGQENMLGSVTLSGRSASHVNGKRNDYTRHRVAISLVPAENPDLIMMMVIDEPGCSVANHDDLDLAFVMDELIPPVAALQQVMKNLADMVKPKEREERNFQAGSDSHEKQGQGSTIPRLVISKMPDLTGMSLRKSIRILQDTGVEIIVEGSGRVVGHEPGAGAALVSGATVTLILERDAVDFADESSGDNANTNESD